MCLFWCVVYIQPVDDMSVSDPLEIHCLVDTPNITNSDDVTISWTGPNGTITNDNRLNITPTVSNGTNHLSTLQFSYLSEDDEGLYECNTAVLDYNKNKTASVELTNFTSELIWKKSRHVCMRTCMCACVCDR